MTIITAGLLLLIVLLAAAALAVPLARWLSQPVAVLLAAVGLVLGVGLSMTREALTGHFLDTYDLWFFEQLAFDSHAMLYLFLPPLLFEMTLAVNVRRLMDDLVVVMVMAILAVLLTTGVIGLSLYFASPLVLAACFLLGAAVATTDPGAVISTFREIGAPRRLLVILEGESLLNDAAAITIFGLMLGILRLKVPPTLADIAVDFLYSFGAGAVVGWAIAMVAGRIYSLLVRSNVAEITVTVVVAYASFIVAEQSVGGSGVVAVVFAGLTTGWAGFMRMGPGNWQTARAVWHQIGFWANALIMIIATAIVPSLIMDLGWKVAPLTLIVYFGAIAARAAILLGFLPLLAKLRLAAPLTKHQSYLLSWGGVRGSVTLVLAISISNLQVLGDDARILAAVAASYTLMTIFLNGSTLAWLTGLLGLNRLSATDLALREKIVAGSLMRVREVVRNIVRERHLEPEALATVEAALGKQYAETEALAMAQAGGERIPFGERLRLGLTIVSGQENRLIRRAFEEGAIGPRAAGALRLTADRIADGGRTDGRDGYEIAATEALRPSAAYRAAIWIRRLVRQDQPLRAAIELHFITLLESERIVRELRNYVTYTVAPMIGDDAAQNLAALLAERHDAINAQIEVIAAQYPRYASDVEKTLVARAAIRRERQQYERLLNDGVVGQELFDDLKVDLDRRERIVARAPRLDLTLKPAALLERVPIFQDLNAEQRKLVARVLRTQFSSPGEVVVREGERGTAMYFIASGAMEVLIDPEPVQLGTGDYFGEIALIYPLRRRRSTVVSKGFSRLLTLKRKDFVRLAEKDPSIESLIRKTEREWRPTALSGVLPMPSENE
jgi:CPA1 family monovalent cation:H+ antiporter